jgi:uncharacterized FAD-dependent dehydrogenase
MKEIIQIQVLPEKINDNQLIRKELTSKISFDSSFEFRLLKRSLDARKKQLKYNLTFEVYSKDEVFEEEGDLFTSIIDVSQKEKVHIIGSGPAGLYAALRSIELGLKPIVYERGKNVKDRRRDLARLNKEHIVNTESNYCFGEGGAGTYSDGKLYTRSKKRGDVEKALKILVRFGADPDILIDAHPHIGTNKLPKLIENIREFIIASGGEIHFENKLTDISIISNRIDSITINSSKQIPVSHLVLATGHSARDIYYLLDAKKVSLKAKSFALGVRVEHTQDLIDRIQYHGRLNDDFIPPASYSLVCQVDGKGVYSFCMCPGGIIAPCSTDTDEVVTNGWSPSKRNNPYSNSGIVVSVSPEDLSNEKNNPFVCLDFQKKVENDCWISAGKSQVVPAQRLKDFVEGKLSPTFPRSSYQPGIVSVRLDQILPKFISTRLQKSFVEFDKKMPGFLTNDAVVHAPESRTSSPVQIPRDPITRMHPDVYGLYPCAEGAGYAGGIISAAIDGMKSIDAVFNSIDKTN